MSNTPIIQCRDAIANIDGFDYEGNPLNLDAFAGEMINIIGPDYSGKSSWTRMICGMDRSYAGTVSIFEKPLNSYKRTDWIHLRKNIAYIETDTTLLSAANGLQNVLLPALYHSIDTPTNITRRAKQLLNEITPDTDPLVLPARIRRDQRYKIAIARALILKPQALVLDNPFALLDVATAKRFKDFLLQHSIKNNILIIIVSHDIQFALKYSDKILFANKNQLQLFNSESEITSSDDPDITEFLSISL